MLLIRIRCKNIFFFILEFISSRSKCMQISFSFSLFFKTPNWLYYFDWNFHINRRYLESLEKESRGKEIGEGLVGGTFCDKEFHSAARDKLENIHTIVRIGCPQFPNRKTSENRWRGPNRLFRMSGAGSPGGLLNRPSISSGFFSQQETSEKYLPSVSLPDLYYLR